tara:strand:+ start:1424 stop:3811 length:2388 start_codon:yes stop_codon:yes gene_type:complete
MINKSLTLLLLFSIVLNNFAFGEEGADEQILISNIIIEGNNRVTNSTVLSYAEVNVGDKFSPDLIKGIIKKLYATNFFDNISVVLEFNNLIINVVEKAIISDIKITGNESVEDEAILEALQNVGVSRSRPYDKNIFDKVEQELVRLYIDRGRYNAQIVSNVDKLERNRVALELIITEGEASRIKEINIIGNKVYPNKKLISLMESGTKYFFEVWSDKDTYAGTKLKSDLERIENFYFNKGFIRFRILSNQVNLSNNNEDIVLTISVDEGEIYQFGDIKLFGNTAIVEENVKSSLLKILKPKEIFSRQKIEQAKGRIAYLLGDKGYPFPDIVSIPIIDDETNIVDLEFRVNPGQRSMVRRINIRGNDNTNDEVYRRELRQYESSLHSNSSIERSAVRIQRLKFVENVDVEKTKVPGSDDLVDLTFNIKERQSGEFKVSAGWSDTDGALFDIKLQQDNFLGGGKNIGVIANKSSISSSLRFIFTDPYYSADGVSRSTNFQISQTDVSSTSTATYVADTFGGGVFYLAPISENESFGIGYDVKVTDFTTTSGSPLIVTHHIADHGKTAFGVSLTGQYIYDTRDRTVFASEGNLFDISPNMFFAANGASYAAATFSSEHNTPYTLKTFGFDWETVLQLKTRVGIGAGLFGATSMPFYSKYFAGGNRSVRGFKGSSLGPLTYNAPRAENTCAAKAVSGKFIKCDAVGGDFLTTAQANWIFPPPPFLGVDTRSARVTLFADMGNVFEDVNDFDYNDLRASYGIEAKFLTPVGAVSVGFVDTFISKEGDDTQPVIFSLGGSF